MTIYNAFDVASYIVNSCIDRGKPISNLKLQKILYYAQAAKLVQDGKPLFRDAIMAWKYGPVVEGVYHYFKTNVNRPIFNKVDDDFCNQLSTKDKGLVDKVVAKQEQFTAFELVENTHEEDPWKNNDFEINNKDIQDYFTQHKNRMW